MNDFRQRKSDLRDVRKKEVADMVNDVLKDKTDLLNVEASLHSLFAKQDKNHREDRDVMHRVLHCNIVLARAVSHLSKEVDQLKSSLRSQKSLENQQRGNCLV